LDLGSNTVERISNPLAFNAWRDYLAAPTNRPGIPQIRFYIMHDVPCVM
jgi:hypothetical protein